MNKTFKAAVLVSPGKMEIQEFPKPTLEEGAMLVETIMCGICGTDKHAYKGEAVQYAGTPREMEGPYPQIPGHEMVSRIVEIRHPKNGKVTDFYGQELKEGDRLAIGPDILCGKCYWCRHSFGYTWCDDMIAYGHIDSSISPHLLGAWAERMYVYPHSHFFKLEEDIPDEIAVLAEPMAVTYSLDIAKGMSSLPVEGFTSGANIVIYGVGPLGLLHLIKSRFLGAAQVVAIDKSEFRLNLSREFGADYTINVKDTEPKERIEGILDITKGRGADIVVESAGVKEVIIEGIDALRQGGTFVEVGNFVDLGNIEINPHRHLCAKQIRLIGQMNYAYVGIIPSIRLLMANRKNFDFSKIITHRYKFLQSEEALLKSMQDECMKVVISS
jgi:L-iditol 2-dehydrogenase